MTKIFVSTIGHQKDLEGSCEKVAHGAEGQYFFRNNKHYVKYDDSCMDDENVIRTTLKTDGETLNIFRRGAVDTDMTFVVGKTTRTAYRTPYNLMELEISTKKLDIAMGEAAGQMELCYDMAVNGELVGEYNLSIKITKAE